MLFLCKLFVFFSTAFLSLSSFRSFFLLPPLRLPLALDICSLYSCTRESEAHISHYEGQWDELSGRINALEMSMVLVNHSIFHSFIYVELDVLFRKRFVNILILLCVWVEKQMLDTVISWCRETKNNSSQVYTQRIKRKRERERERQGESVCVHQGKLQRDERDNKNSWQRCPLHCFIWWMEEA